MMIEWVLLLGAILLGAMWVARGGSLDGRPAARGETPGDILERRLAKGEISVEEYRERQAVLTGVYSPGSR